MEFRHLKFFLALCETSHFGRAAQQLGTTQPNLTRQIRALEQELGASLFSRDRRRVEITNAGRTIEPLARRVQSLEGQIHRAVSGGARKASIVMAHVPAALTTVVPPAVLSLKQIVPHAELQLVELFPPAVAAAVRSGEASLGFGIGCDGDGLASACVASIPYALVLSRTHRLALRRGSISLAHLAGERWVTIPDDCRPLPRCRMLARVSELGLASARRQCPTQQGIMALVAAGEGFGLMPETLARMRYPGVIFKQPQERLPTFDILLLWREDEDRPEILRLIESLRGTVGRPPEKQTLR